MDELLQARVQQLKEIDDRLERLLAAYKARVLSPAPYSQAAVIHDFLSGIRSLRTDLAKMTSDAELEHAEF